MYFYADCYFILNFIMNFFLIMLTAKIRKKQAVMKRYFVLSVLYGILSCITAYVLWEEKVWNYVAAIIEMASFLYFNFKSKTFKEWLYDFEMFLGVIVFTAGFIFFFYQTIWQIAGKKTLSIQAVGISVILLFLLFQILRYDLIKQEQWSKTVLQGNVRHHGSTYCIWVLFDTGNHLTNPFNGERVNIVSETFAGKMHLSEGQLPVYIPYHSIGGSGVLPAYRIEELEVQGRETQYNVLAAVSEQLCADSKIQMILNIT